MKNIADNVHSPINPPAMAKLSKFHDHLTSLIGDNQEPHTASPVHRSPVKPQRRPQKYRSMTEIMEVAAYAVIEDLEDDYNEVICVKCGSGDKDEQLLLCDNCDRGYHMECVTPIVARVPNGDWQCPNCTDHHPQLKSLIPINIHDFFMIEKLDSTSSKMSSSQDSRKQKRRTNTLVHHKKRRRLLPYIPSEEADQRLKQMRSLASALKSLNLEFSNDLTYPPGMAPESANQATLENGGVQVLSKRDTETYYECRAMAKRGEYPPLRIVFDRSQGFTVQADGLIKDMTLIAEYTGDVDYIKNRESDDCDSLMTLLLTTDPDKSLVICPDKRGNIARFISGINNHIPGSRKTINVKCIRYDVEGACRNLLVATRDINKDEKLYYDYNGSENKYPTQHFV